MVLPPVLLLAGAAAVGVLSTVERFGQAADQARAEILPLTALEGALLGVAVPAYDSLAEPVPDLPLPRDSRAVSADRRPLAERPGQAGQNSTAL